MPAPGPPDGSDAEPPSAAPPPPDAPPASRRRRRPAAALPQRRSPAAAPAAARRAPAVETTTRLRPIAAPRSAPPGPRLPAGVPPRPVAPPARRRPVGAVDLTPPGPAHAPRTPARGHSWPPPETPAEMTTRLRPVRTRHPARTLGAVACVVLGLGLIGGAATGSWLTGDSSADPAARTGYTETPDLWHSVPVDTLFPRTLKGDGAGPGGADRVWTRIAVAPDGGCAPALDPLLLKTLAAGRLRAACCAPPTPTPPPAASPRSA